MKVDFEFLLPAFVSPLESLFTCFHMMLCHCDFDSTDLSIAPSEVLGLLFYSHVALLPFVFISIMCGLILLCVVL